MLVLFSKDIITQLKQAPNSVSFACMAMHDLQADTSSYETFETFDHLFISVRKILLTKHNCQQGSSPFVLAAIWLLSRLDSSRKQCLLSKIITAGPSRLINAL